MMKDKLYKHHKNPRYFLLKKVAIIFALVAGLTLSITIPLAIRAHNRALQTDIVCLNNK